MDKEIKEPKRRKLFEELTITDDFMFAKVMLNQRLCKKFLEMILSVRIQKITYPQEQKVIDNDYDAKAVRLDVYVNDETGTVYDAEMQADYRGNLPRRSRYYQGAVDLEQLERGTDYNELPKSYIIFICTFDLFGTGRHIYTFKNTCFEDKGLLLEDGTARVFVNTKGTADDICPELQDVMDYFNGQPAKGEFAKEMEKEVNKVKRNKKWRREYMTLAMIKKEEYKEGMESGMKKGIISSIMVLLSVNIDEETAITTVASQYGMTADEIRHIWKNR